MKEREFQATVVEMAERFGWRVWHVPTPMRPVGGSKFVPDRRGRGLPDLIMLHDCPPTLIFAELKTDSGVESIEQKEFLRLARAVSDETSGDRRVVKALSWRPSHFDLIEATLRR